MDWIQHVTQQWDQIGTEIFILVFSPILQFNISNLHHQPHRGILRDILRLKVMFQDLSRVTVMQFPAQVIVGPYLKSMRFELLILDL